MIHLFLRVLFRFKRGTGVVGELPKRFPGPAPSPWRRLGSMRGLCCRLWAVRVGVSHGSRHALGCIPQELGGHAICGPQLKEAGYSAALLKYAGNSVAQLKDAGYSAMQLREAGYSAALLREMTGTTFTA